jgi:hypothetical protein
VDCGDWDDDGGGRNDEETGKEKGALTGMKVSQAGTPFIMGLEPAMGDAKVSYQRPVALNDALTYKAHDNEKPRLR